MVGFADISQTMVNRGGSTVNVIRVVGRLRSRFLPETASC